MAGAIGFALGATLNGLSGYAAEKTAQKHEHQQMWDQFMTKNLNGNPEFAQTAEGRKEVKRLYGEHADAAQAAYDFAAQAKQQSQQQLAGAMGKEPQTMQEWQDHANKLAQFSALHANDPNFAQIKPQLDAEVKRAETQVNQMRVDQRDREFHAEHEQDVAAGRADRRQAHEDAMSNSAASREGTMAFREATLAQTKAAEADRNDLAKSMQDIKKAEDEEKRQLATETASKNVDASRDKVLADFAKAPSAEKPAYKARVDSHNTSAVEFYTKHAGSGAPTLLKLNPPTPGRAPFGLTDSDPTIDAIPPRFGKNKKTGQSGWYDADGNFYTDSQ